MQSIPQNPLIAIVGATGTGKSQLAVAIAKRFNGEIINGDAMQLYNGLPIITNKITPEEQQGIPHHLLGCIGIDEQPWVVRSFVHRALKVLDEIRARGRLPILVGGTHYYTQSLLFHDRLATNEVESAEEVNVIEDTAKIWPILAQPTEEIAAELRRVDPVMADRWHPNDRRKIKRSLEIFLQTGRRASEMYAEQRQRETPADSLEEENGPRLRFPTLVFWVHASDSQLQPRLDTRVDKMIAQGLLEEVHTLDRFANSHELEGKAIDYTKGIWVSIGYKEFKDYSRATKSEATESIDATRLKATGLEKTKIATRQYAKRQIRWIRIKLVNALRAAQAEKAFFLLDGSDISTFETQVEEPALKITRSFLEGEQLPNSQSTSALASEMLTPKRDYDLSSTPEKWIREHCDVCCVTCVSPEQWQLHIKSKRHRKLVSIAKHQPTQIPTQVDGTKALD